MVAKLPWFVGWVPARNRIFGWFSELSSKRNELKRSSRETGRLKGFKKERQTWESLNLPGANSDSSPTSASFIYGKSSIYEKFGVFWCFSIHLSFWCAGTFYWASETLLWVSVRRAMCSVFLVTKTARSSGEWDTETGLKGKPPRSQTLAPILTL